MNGLLRHVIERKRIEVKGRRGRRSNHILEDVKETRGYRKLQDEALERTLRRTRFGRFYGTVLRQTTARLNECTVATTGRCSVYPNTTFPRLISVLSFHSASVFKCSLLV
jgi:hypothetical protein